MKISKKQAVKTAIGKIGKAIWSALPWVGLFILTACLVIAPILRAEERGELKAQISALEAENAMREYENARLDAEIGWLRSLVEEDSDGKAQ